MRLNIIHYSLLWLFYCFLCPFMVFLYQGGMMMEEKFYSVEDVSKILRLHVKTLRRYITEGKLRASKVGKQYRISGHDLSVFLENSGLYPAENGQDIPHTATVNVSAVMEIMAGSAEDADRYESMMLAAMNTKDPSYGQSAAHVQRFEDRKKMRVLLFGSLRFIADMLECFALVINDKESGMRHEDH